MKTFYRSSLVLLSAFSVSAYAIAPKVIYGEDNRADVYAATNEMHRELALSTAAMIGGSNLSSNGSEVKIVGRSLQSRGMCASERFANQVTAARCSGFLVGEDLLVTAGHCVTNAADCANYSWVFDYRMQDANSANISVPAGSVYRCKEIISRALDRGTQDDYALVRLDRKVQDRRVLDFRRDGKIEQGTKIVVIGHPTGLPTKIADGAKVRDNSAAKFFVANLDTYGGNSGSAVFDAETGIIEGILVRGETDYTYDSRQGCQASYRCTDDGCRGEDVTRITNIPQLRNL